MLRFFSHRGPVNCRQQLTRLRQAKDRSWRQHSSSQQSIGNSYNLPPVRVLGPAVFCVTTTVAVYLIFASYEVHRDARRYAQAFRSSPASYEQLQSLLPPLNAHRRSSSPNNSPMEPLRNLSETQRYIFGNIALTAGLYAALASPYTSSLTEALVHQPIRGLNYTMTTAMFAHSSGWHLALNMYCLYNFGSAVGSSRVFQGSGAHLTAFYLAAGTLSSMGAQLEALFPSRRLYAGLGASGAISALIGVFAAVNPDARIGIILIPGTVDATTAVSLMAAFETYGMIIGFPYIRWGHSVHLAGLAVGTAYAHFDKNGAIWSNTRRLAFNQLRRVDLTIIRGYFGHFAGNYVQVYADTAICPNQSGYVSGQNCGYTGANTIVSETFVPTLVTNYFSDPKEFCIYFAGAPGRLHVGNLVSTGPKTGILYYQNISVPYSKTGPCGNIDDCSSSGGIAAITADSNGNPVCTPQQSYWSVANDEPLWGSSGAIGASDGYIYLVGQLDSQSPSSSASDVHLARVLNGSQVTSTAYQYWNGTAYSSKRIQDPVYDGAYDPSSILQGVGFLGSFFYNAYYSKYVVLGVTTGNNITAYTASQPQGPWSAPVSIYYNSSYIDNFNNALYSSIALPARDLSGKSLYMAMSWSQRNSVSLVAKVNFA